MNPWLARRRRTDPGSRRERALESRLVWIFGSPRSGSTWLLNLLAHPLTAAEDSPLGVVRLNAPEADAPHAIPINEPYAQEHLAPSLADDLVAGGKLPFGTLPELRRAAPNYFLADRYGEAWRPHLRRLVLARLLAQVDAISREHKLHRSWVVIKEPNGSIGAEFVMSLLPRSRLIFLLRDGRDVVDSMLDAQMPGGWLADAGTSEAKVLERRRHELVERESRLWLARTRAVRRAYDAHPPQLRHLMRYEEARADTGAALRRLEAWLGFTRTERGHADALRWNDFDAIPAEAKGSGKPLRAAQPGLWRENLSAREQAAMRAIIGAELQALGYEL